MKDCSCNVCVSACSHMPGWFSPEQIDLSKESPEFLENLIVDYRMENDAPFFVLRPKMESEKDRNMAALNLKTGSPCVFLNSENRCSIHERKPFECRQSMCCEKPTDEDLKLRERIAVMWLDHQSLAGRAKSIDSSKELKKLESEFTVFDHFDMLLSHLDRMASLSKSINQLNKGV